MNLRSIDLNLLVVLDALLDEAHVTRAADRLALSQPATSAALERCRALFDDLLLVRNGARMTLTPRAQALRAPVKEALAAVQQLLDPAPPSLQALAATVRIGLADALVARLLPALLARLQVTAPGLCIVCLPWQGGGDLLRQLDDGGLDLALSVLPPASGRLRRLELLHERYVVAMRRDHPAARDFGLDAWLAHPHVLVSSHGDTRGALDDALLASGRTRRVGAVVPSFLAALALLERSDLIGLLPSRCLGASEADRFASFAPPLPVDGFALALAWHARRDGDAAVQHVATLLRELLADPAPLSP
ncbi:LysR family transcriptional regulator [Derxia lacustris]|uniref:LysR family transcriptional regulator n=1 Tax=Derxia lacustris TaxID=764842 RepID=UPI000A171746|nr:LysR family transcriptional regulator [Derxia lacustris]